MGDDDPRKAVAASSLSLEEQLKQTALASRQRETLLLTSADRTKRKADCLRFKLERLDVCVKRLRTEAIEARRMHDALQFDALCLALRRNDPATTELIDTDFYPVGYARRLGEALQGNTHVATLKLDLEKLIPPASMHETNVVDPSKMLGFAEPLMSSIRNGSAMRSLKIHSEFWDESFEPLLGSLMEAAFENRSAMRELTCSPPIMPTSTTPFHAGMRSDVLEKLDVRFCDDDMYSRGDRIRIREAFRQCSRLQSLRVQTEDEDIAVMILEGLKGGMQDSSFPFQLRELKFKCHYSIQTLAYWVALSELVHATDRLKHLQLEGVLDMDAFLACLAPPCSISKVSLLDCCVENGAIDSLEQFMKMRKQPDSGGVLLEEFAIDWMCSAEDLCASSFASMFFLQQEDDEEAWYSTLGSSLHTLSVSSIQHGCYGFLDTMANNSHRLEIKNVKLAELDEADCENLATWISRTHSLQELTLNDISDAHRILASLRCNGTLHTVFMPGEKESRLANNYCARNKQLGQLIESLTSVESDTVQEMKDHKECSKETRSAQSVLPTLLQCAKQISTTRASTALSSLLSLSDSIGSV
jgi:hypothetical protein